MQLESCHFEGAKDNGNTYMREVGFPNHTAVVIAASNPNFRVLEQNFGHCKLVRESLYQLKDCKRGKIRFYRPLPPAP
eukprot:m.129496 g.129496  ORF g.129496 m.129496 type:complete len:78 (+) comp9769_c0_seq2:621-854(+)